jgi:hypothetical protein
MRLIWKKTFTGMTIDAWDVYTPFQQLGTIIKNKLKDSWDSSSYITGRSSRFDITLDEAISHIINEANRARA